MNYHPPVTVDTRGTISTIWYKSCSSLRSGWKMTFLKKLKLPAHRARLPEHASGEQNVSKGSFIHIVPLNYAHKAGFRGPFRPA